MRRRRIGIGLSGPLAGLMIVVMFGCGLSPVTSARIEGAVAPTFANLVQLQVSRLGMPPMAASDFGVRASCRKQAGGTSGAGELALHAHVVCASRGLRYRVSLPPTSVYRLWDDDAGATASEAEDQLGRAYGLQAIGRTAATSGISSSVRRVLRYDQRGDQKGAEVRAAVACDTRNCKRRCPPESCSTPTKPGTARIERNAGSGPWWRRPSCSTRSPPRAARTRCGAYSAPP